LLLLVAALSARAQGTLDDYQRAERFLLQKMRKLVFSGDVAPHWIEKSNRFWYRAVGPKGAEFKLVDAEKIRLLRPLTMSNSRLRFRKPQRKNSRPAICHSKALSSPKEEDPSASAWRKSSGRAQSALQITNAKKLLTPERISTKHCHQMESLLLT
jgi:hypothetical protein